MKITIDRLDDAFQFEATTEEGNQLKMDGKASIGGAETAPSPMQLLPSALGGCSGIDVVMILKKQKQQIEDFKIEIDAEREKQGDVSLFTHMHIKFTFKGQLDEGKVERAIALSLDKYCSVAKTLEAAGCKISSSFEINP